MTRRYTWSMATMAVFAALSGAGIAGYDAVHHSVASASAFSNLTDVYGINVSRNPEVGSNKAPVTILEFGDLKCPHCADFAQTVLPSIKKNFIDTGEARLFFVNFPVLGPQSILAAQMGEAIYQQSPTAFWKWYGGVYRTVATEIKNPDSNYGTLKYYDGLIKRYVPKVNISKVNRAVAQHTYLSLVNQNAMQGTHIGVRGTPTVFINGVEAPDPYSVSAISHMIAGAVR